MFFKEWLLVKQKLILMVALYGGAGFIYTTIWGPQHALNPQPLFNSWFMAALFITAGLAILGGVDVIAEENDKGTIGFLLTRPLSRAKIYTSKLALNGAALAAVAVTSSVVIFFLGQIPREYTTFTYTSNGCADVVFNETGTALVPTVSFGNALLGTAALLAVGAVFLCLSALISVYARTTIQALLWTILSLIVPVAGYYIYNSNNFSYTTDVIDAMGLRIIFFLIPLAAILFGAGLYSFKRKEF